MSFLMLVLLSPFLFGSACFESLVKTTRSIAESAPPARKPRLVQVTRWEGKFFQNEAGFDLTGFTWEDAITLDFEYTLLSTASVTDKGQPVLLAADTQKLAQFATAGSAFFTEQTVSTSNDNVLATRRIEIVAAQSGAGPGTVHEYEIISTSINPKLSGSDKVSPPFKILLIQSERELPRLSLTCTTVKPVGPGESADINYEVHNYQKFSIHAPDGAQLFSDEQGFQDARTTGRLVKSKTGKLAVVPSQLGVNVYSCRAEDAFRNPSAVNVPIRVTLCPGGKDPVFVSGCTLMDSPNFRCHWCQDFHAPGCTLDEAKRNQERTCTNCQHRFDVPCSSIPDCPQAGCRE